MAQKKKDATAAVKAMSKKLNGGPVNLVLVCDESGSMMGNEEAVVTGVNEFVHSFREHDAKVTLSMFDKHPGEPRVRVKYAGKSAKKVKDLKVSDYRPRGTTPLRDAIIDTIEALDKSTKEGERAFVVILTDGLENASENSAETVAKLIRKREKQGWAFLYLGANHDVSASAASIGLSKQGQSFMFSSTKRGTSSALRSATNLGMGYVADSGAYPAMASAAFASTGGVIDEDADEAQEQIEKAKRKTTASTK